MKRDIFIESNGLPRTGDLFAHDPEASDMVDDYGFQAKTEIFSNPFNILPGSPDFGNFKNAWSYAPFASYYLNTIITSFGLLAIQLVTITMAAYAFARLQFPGRDFFFILFLTQLMITPQSTILPNYLTISQMGLIDNQLGVMLPYFALGHGHLFDETGFQKRPESQEEIRQTRRLQSPFS